MPTSTTLLAFALASLLLAVTPGPSLVLLLAVGTERGRRDALLTALGLAAGTAAWVVVTAAGLGAALERRPELLDAVTLVGAAYLGWLAVRAVRRPGRADAGPGTPGPPDDDTVGPDGAGTRRTPGGAHSPTGRS